VTEIFFPYFNHWPGGAAAHAVHAFQGVIQILCSLAARHSQLPFQRLQYQFRAPYVAGGAQANIDNMLAPLLEAESTEEGDTRPLWGISIFLLAFQRFAGQVVIFAGISTRWIPAGFCLPYFFKIPVTDLHLDYFLRPTDLVVFFFYFPVSRIVCQWRNLGSAPKP
jgi:hypothetical protein